MALSDPTVHVSNVPSTLARIDLAKNKGTFISSDGLLEMNISSTFSPKSGASTLVRLDQKKYITDPVTNVAKVGVASAWLVVRRVDNGTFTIGELSDLAGAIATFVGDSAIFDRILVGEA